MVGIRDKWGFGGGAPNGEALFQRCLHRKSLTLKEKRSKRTNSPQNKEDKARQGLKTPPQTLSSPYPVHPGLL